MSKLRILTFTTLYPNAAQPTHGIFVENRMRSLVDRHDLDLKIIAPAPWFPLKATCFGQYATYARIPAAEVRQGMEIFHPRYVAIPKVGMTFAVHSLTRCLVKEARRLQAEGWDFDLIDAHYYYPDGVAAARAGEVLGKPVIITARGTDINLIPEFPRQRRMILEASAMAEASVTVCQALKDEMIEIGALGTKISVLRNGVDLELFKPLDRSLIRKKLDVNGTVLLSVGHLIKRKGHDIAIEALTRIADATLLIAGEGPERRQLERLAEECDVSERVRFLGAIPHEALAEIYNAADILVLASSREGWPNVLLESMACGTPCVASPVWGTKEIITDPAAGRVTDKRTSEAFTTAINILLTRPPERNATRQFAEKYSWSETADNLYTLFSNSVKAHRARRERDEKAETNDWRVAHPFHLKKKRPSLLVTVDTEEIFDWTASHYEQFSLADVRDIDQFQSCCQDAELKPLYFISWPLLNDRETSAYYSKLNKSGHADAGIHVHHWVTPPIAADATTRSTYQCHLPGELHRKKLAEMCRIFEAVFDKSPDAHRAGRYGVSPSVHQDLIDTGIRFDFSPSAGFDHSGDGGPDFSGVTSRAWWRQNRTGEQELLCIPVTGGRCLKRTNIVLPQHASRTGNFFPLSSLVGRMTAPVRLSPENFTLSDLQALTKRVVNDGTDLLTFSLHSTSLTLGATPYSTSRTQIETLLQTSAEYFSWFKKEIGDPISLEQLRELAPGEKAAD